MQKQLLACLLLLAQTGFAQKKADSAGYIHPDYKWAVNWSPLALAQLDFTLLAGGEYRHTSKLSFVADAGYIFGSLIYNSRTNDKQGQGFIFRPGIRLYTAVTKGNYLQGQFFYKQVTHRLYDWLDKNVVNNVASYQELQDFRIRRSVFGLNVVVGRNVKLGDKVLFDFYLGAGVRYKTTFIVDEPNSRYNFTRSFVNSDGENDRPSVLPSLPVGGRLVLLL